MSHLCPRPECERVVPDEQFACRPDWYALPAPIRYAIWDGYRSGDVAAHLAAMTDARDWYRAHPPKTSRATRTAGKTGEAHEDLP